MAIIQDVRPSQTESAYVEKPFDEAKVELEAGGYNIVSLEQFARLRIAQGKDSHVANYGAYVREGFLYVPEKGIFLVRNSPILANAKEATDCHRKGKEFYLPPEEVDRMLVNSVQFKDASSIPTNRFAEDERTVFAFGEIAGKYGEFLEEAGINEMPLLLANMEQKPFAKQVWLRRLDGVSRSGLLGGGRRLLYNDAVRGVRNVEPRSGETVSKISMPRLIDIVRYSKQFVPEFARADFEKGLGALFGKQ